MLYFTRGGKENEKKKRERGGVEEGERKNGRWRMDNVKKRMANGKWDRERGEERMEMEMQGARSREQERGKREEG